MRPLDFLRSIKVKLGVVIVFAVFTQFLVNEIGLALNVSVKARIAVAITISLIIVQVLAHGMVAPLREMAAAARKMAKGQTGVRVRATSRDEVGELARAFNSMVSELAEVDRQRRTLIANVSHELRTPIAALHALLENLVDGVAEPDPRTLRTALAQTERLNRLVGQVLDLTRLESGTTRLQLEPVELEPLCAQAIREAHLAAGDGRVELLHSVEPPDLVVHADPAWLPQVLSNLLDNAVRHSPLGGRVELCAGAQDGGVRISVTDQGPGIPPIDRTRIFQRFSRLDTGRAADSGGTGLGLAIACEVVELHAGTIRVDDNTKQGCRLVIDLPRRRP